MLLHIVNKSPFERNALTSCLRHAKNGGSVLLLEDGVYGALTDTAFTPDIEAALKVLAVYALAPDVQARGIGRRLVAGVKTVDYDGFVDLVVRHEAVQSWL